MTSELRSAPADGGSDELTLSPIRILLALTRQRWVLAVTPLMTGVLFAAGSWLMRDYVALTSFATQSTSAGSLASVAAQFGVSIPPTSGPSTQLYSKIITSRDLLARVVAETLSYRPSASDTALRRETLIQAFGVDEETELERLVEAIDELTDRIDVSTDDEAASVTIRVRMQSGGLAEAVARSLLEGVQRFDRERRQSQAKSERLFVEQRLAEAATDLQAAEGELERFLERNARVEAPRLVFERQRLDRRVELRQQVYLTLAQTFEQARIEEVRNTPVITLIDEPERTAEAASRPLLVGALGAMLGVMVGFFLAGWREWYAWSAVVSPGEIEALKASWRPPLRRRRGHASADAVDERRE